MVDKEKIKGKAEEIKGKLEQAVGKATGSEQTQRRGKIDETKGRIRGKVADVRGAVKKVLGSHLNGVNLTRITIGVGGAFILIGLFRTLLPGARRLSPFR